MAQGFRIADAYVQVRAEDGNLRRDVSNAVRNAGRGQDIGVRVTADSSRLRSEVRSAVAGVRTRDGIRVRLTVDAAQLRRDVANAIRLASRGQSIRVRVDLDTGNALARIAAMRAATAGVSGSVGAASNSVSGMGTSWASVGLIATGVLAAIQVGAPIAAAAIATSLPVAFGALGAFALKADQDVKVAFADMKTSVGQSLREAAEPLKPYLIDGIRTLGAELNNLPLREVFAVTGPLIDPLVRGITNLAEAALPGIEAALSRSGPMMTAFSGALTDIGQGISTLFDKITSGANADALSRVWELLGEGIEEAMSAIGDLLSDLLSDKFAVESIGMAFDLLANTIRAVGSVIDLVTPLIYGLIAVADGVAKAVVWAADGLDGLSNSLLGMLPGGEILKAVLGDGATSMAVAGTAADAASAQVEALRASLGGTSGSSNEAAEVTARFGAEAARTGATLDAQKKSADALRQSIYALNDANRSALDAQSALEASIDLAATAAKENAGALDMSHGKLNLNSEAARKNYDALSDLASKTQEAAAAARDNGASWNEVASIHSRGRGQLVSLAQQMGLTKSEAAKLADQILKTPDVKIKNNSAATIGELQGLVRQLKGVPSGKTITIKAPTSAAVKALKDAGYNVKAIPGSKNVRVTAPTGTAITNVKALRGQIEALRSRQIMITTVNRKINEIINKTTGILTGGKRAFGGPIYGPGTSTSDSIPMMLSDGEFVIRAASVTKYGLPFLNALNEGRLGLGMYAAGGKVSKAEAARRAAAKAESDARKAATSELTITHFGQIGGFKNTEIVNQLAKPSDVGALSSSLNKWRSVIQKSTHGKTESSLLKSLDITGKALFDNKRKLDSVNSSLDKAKSNLDDLRSKFDSLRTSVSSNLAGFANITKVGKWGTSVDTILGQARSDASRTTAFAGQLEELRRRGLNSTMLQDIAEAGVTGGGAATATSLLNATPTQIAELNKLQTQIQSSADKAGTSVATSMYGAGIKAAEGLVAGLQSQQDAIEATMLKLAKSMESAIKRALGIKSPSRVMMELGAHTSQGFADGITANPAPLYASKMMAKAPVYAATAPAASKPQWAGGSTVIHLSPTFNTMTVPSAAERKRFAQAMAKDLNDALRDYQRERR